MALNDAVGLLFTIKADSDGATKELDKFFKDVKSKSDDISSSGENAFRTDGRERAINPHESHLTGNICIAVSYSSATSESAKSR